MYLTDESDTMVAYEQRGREKTSNVSSYESGMQALQNMGRIPQVEVMHGEHILIQTIINYSKVIIRSVVCCFMLYWPAGRLAPAALTPAPLNCV